MKVFGIGFHKTGTTTLGSALANLDYKVCGYQGQFIEKISKEDYNSVFRIVDKYDAFQDNPWPLLYKELDRHYPGSKFILTYRSEERWIKSVVNHFGNKENEMRTLIYGYGAPLGNEDIYIARYRLHNRKVLDYFKGRENSLTSLSWEKGDGWEELCQFLNKPIPDIPFPHLNTSSERVPKRFHRFHTWIKNSKLNL